MKKILFLFTAFLACLSLFAQSRPNIIHIVLDDVGYDDISCFGSKDIKTPNIDKLAKEGVSLTNFYAPHETCSPSRAAFLTGRLAPRIDHGEGISVLFPNSTDGMSQYETTIAEILQKEGYITALYGKWHLGHMQQFLPPNHGFDYFIGIPYPNDHTPERVSGTGIHYLGEWPPLPLIQGLETVKTLNNWEIGELPSYFQRETCRFINRQAKTGRPFYLQYANIETHTPYFIPRGFEGRSEAGAFGDAVEYADLTVRAIMETVKKCGIEDNTIIVITSDNGPLIGYDEELYRSFGKYGYVDSTRTHLLRGGKYQMWYEGGPRVFCIAKWAGHIPANTKSDAIVNGADLFTTFANAAGADIPTDRIIDGKDIMPIMKGESKGNSEVYYYFKGRTNRIYAVRKGDWKLVFARTPKGEEQRFELYNLKNDVGEQKDVKSSHKNTVDELKNMAKAAQDALDNDKPFEW
ncbi:MAG: sulfatase-like hydrolase/transferase [Bacteroidales bacterium]